MVFGIGFSIAPIGEQPDNLEAIRRAAAYQDCHRHRVTTVLDQLAGETRGARRSLSHATSNMANQCFGRCDGHHKMAISSYAMEGATVCTALLNMAVEPLACAMLIWLGAL